MKIKSIIVDDEQHCIDSLLTDLHQHCPAIEVIQSCSSAKEGIIAIKKYNPHLVFLDVEMPWMNGFEMLEVLDSINFSVIFTTAYSEFAAKAFRISAVDYLVKPIDAGDLREAVVKVQTKIGGSDGMQHITNLLKNIRKPADQQKVALPNRDGYEFTEVLSITHCEAEGAYTKIFLQSGKHILVSKALGDIEEMLPPELFQRIHHSVLVNLSFITQFSRADGGFVIMKSGEKLSVSKSKKEMLLERLGLH